MQYTCRLNYIINISRSSRYPRIGTVLMLVSKLMFHSPKDSQANSQTNKRVHIIQQNTKIREMSRTGQKTAQLLGLKEKRTGKKTC